jgi:hypothetical protein
MMNDGARGLLKKGNDECLRLLGHVPTIGFIGVLPPKNSDFERFTEIRVWQESIVHAIVRWTWPYFARLITSKVLDTWTTVHFVGVPYDAVGRGFGSKTQGAVDVIAACSFCVVLDIEGKRAGVVKAALTALREANKPHCVVTIVGDRAQLDCP